MSLVADHHFFNKWGGSGTDEQKSEKATNKMIDYLEDTNSLYLGTKFDPDGRFTDSGHQY
jgi:hypothetical protein